MKKDTENVIYGKSLQAIRKKNNLTQEQVAQLTGLETKYISQIECGIGKGTISTMLKLCEAYNVTPNDVLSEFIKNSNAKNELDKYNNRFMELSKRDRTVILTLIDALLDKRK